MLLTISTTVSPATDLGFLLFKHPGRVQAFEQAFGTAHVFYPEASGERCTVALLLEVDPVRLVRSRGRTPAGFTLGQYVNDRPYAASSLLSSAMAGVFRSAMRGRCDARPELAGTAIPLEIALPALPCRGGPGLAAALFEPLGWQVRAEPVPLDEAFPAWGESRYVGLTLTGTVRLADALNQLYVLLPVLDDSKHYWVAPDEVDKLIRAGDGWLAAHPERGRITRRYLADRRTLVRTALDRLAEVDDAVEGELERGPLEEEPAPRDGDTTGDAAGDPTGDTADDAVGGLAGDAVPDEPAAPPVPLAERRLEAVIGALHAEQARRVIDLGCGSGNLLRRLLQDPVFDRVTGADVSHRAVTVAVRRLRPDRLPRPQAERLTVFQGALTYTDERFRGYDAAVLMEVIEHVDQPRLPAVERVVFGDARPRSVIVTTPNVEYNVRYEGLAEGARRHPDHRFEWTRAEFREWAGRVTETYGYGVRFLPVGDDDPEVGPPTQLAVFTLGGGS
ncbi:3' terminal RNA ribose 2'-O-methyltransferase Hen1 [Actinomadura scrupuli]|uniref:3' terminal RNA ribose 2'-O-methyltransferase Hen1 n=1 Tax=Actinomadura scrupuli TaxID=559629 RepID=UPI003D9713FC